VLLFLLVSSTIKDRKESFFFFKIKMEQKRFKKTFS
jgi:hypothetical protein